MARFTTPYEAPDFTKITVTDFMPAFEAAMDAYLRDPVCKNIYVHCQAGMNRSATLVVAYVFKRFRVDFAYLINHVARQRPCVMTNLHFQDYLVKFASALHNNVGERAK